MHYKMNKTDNWLEDSRSWGIASLVMSIIGLLLIFAPYIGIFCSILGVVFYGIQKKHRHTGLATAGLVIGIIGVVINSIMLIFVIGLLAFFGGFGSSDDVTIQPTENVINSHENINSDISNNNERLVKSASLTVDRVVETVANLGDIRITVSNTGDVSINPQFDVTVTDSSGKTVCEDSPMFGIGSIPSGEKKTDEIQILGCMFNEDGTYLVKVDLLDEDYNKLDTSSKSLTVDYWDQFDF